jgi:hypothetical protein
VGVISFVVDVPTTFRVEIFPATRVVHPRETKERQEMCVSKKL